MGPASHNSTDRHPHKSSHPFSHSQQNEPVCGCPGACLNSAHTLTHTLTPCINKHTHAYTQTFTHMNELGQTNTLANILKN